MSNILLHNVEIINIKDYIDDSSLDDVISTLKELREKYSDSYGKLRFDVSQEKDYGGDYVKIMLIGDRKETEEEALKREAKDNLYRKNMEIYEKNLLANLLVKYGEPK
jgi:Skp family chaperone for outer membrane proteins